MPWRPTGLLNTHRAFARPKTLPLLAKRALRVALSSSRTSLIEASRATSARSASSSPRSSRVLRRSSLSKSFLASRWVRLSFPWAVRMSSATLG